MVHGRASQERPSQMLSTLALEGLAWWVGSVLIHSSQHSGNEKRKIRKFKNMKKYIWNFRKIWNFRFENAFFLFFYSSLILFVLFTHVHCSEDTPRLWGHCPNNEVYFISQFHTVYSHCIHFMKLDLSKISIVWLVGKSLCEIFQQLMRWSHFEL